MLTTKIKKIIPLIILLLLGISLISCSQEHVHDYILHESIDSTCTTTGSIAYYTCSGCDEYFKDTEGTVIIDHDSVIVALKEHTYQEYSVTLEPTCTLSGTKERYCSVCNHKDSTSIDPVHKFEETWSHNSLNHYHKCSECDELSDVSEHSYVNRICSVCNYETYTEGLLFTLINNDEEYSVSCGEIKDNDVAIPSEYNGKKVTQIVDEAFKNKSEITSIEIPNTIISIGSSAFDGCSSLKNIVIPDTVKTIGAYSFNSCTELETVKMSKNIIFINEYTFANCTKLETLNISSVVNIENYAFYNCSKLKSLVLGSSLAKIGSYAFGSCLEFRTVYYEGSDINTWNYKVLISTTSNLRMINADKLFYSEEAPTTSNTHWHYVETIPTIWE